MEYKIDKENFRIKLNGSKKEIKKFAKCLVEVVDKNLLWEFKHLKFREKLEPFNLNAHERIYLSRDSLTYYLNANEIEEKKIHFHLMEEHYNKAKENYKTSSKR